MALRGTLTHRKTRRLALKLGIDPCFALGLVEALWNVTAEQAQAGDIGRMTNEDICMEMFYSGDPEKLVDALVVSGFVDSDPEHRLVVHDWHLHSDDATDNRVARSGKRYANGAQPRMRKLSEKERTRLCALYGYSVRTACAQESTDEHEKALPEPVPVPEPVPEPVIQKPSRDKREPDPRFTEFKNACEAYYRHKHIEMTWDASEAKQLSQLLAANPTLSLEQFQGILRNRSRSQVNHAERPRKWLSNATEYIAGPVDRFNKPQEAGNAGRTFTGTRSKSGQVIDDLRRSLEEDGYSFGIGEVGDSPAIEPWQGNDGSVRSRSGGDEPGGRALGAGITLLPPAG